MNEKEETRPNKKTSRRHNRKTQDNLVRVDKRKGPNKALVLISAWSNGLTKSLGAKGLDCLDGGQQLQPTLNGLVPTVFHAIGWVP
jgi:hypothetical protein